jgi:hypothetical protein
MTALHSKTTRARALSGDDVSFTEEARRIQGRALEGQACVVRLGQVVFFSTESGDAWMLDPEDGYAACLARDFTPWRIPIQETPAKLAIEWEADYTIEGEAFAVVEREGSARTILGYPTAEIQHLASEVSPTPGQGDDAEQARERLKSGRNDLCPCGSGKKYKKCCLARDEALARQSAATGLPQWDEPAEPDLSMPTDVSGTAADDTAFHGLANSAGEIDAKIPPEVQRKADALWDEFEARQQPTAEQMDAFLASLLALPPEATDWSELFHRFARLNYPDLPGVFRRIAASVPHTGEAGMAFFYWAAAAEFACGQYRHLLPEVATASRKLGLGSYDADGLSHLEDYLLAEGFDTETLELAEHFLPVLRADDDLMPYAGDIRSDDEAWRQNLRLYGGLMHVARETWQLEQRPPGCAFRGLSLMLTSVYDWQDASGKRRKRPISNLLDALRPSGLEPRLVRACPEVMGVNEHRARLLLDAHGILLRFAERHQLVADADAAELRTELARLQHALDRRN